MSERKIVVGVDGSEHAARAVAWCARHAAAMNAEVVVVHAVELPAFAPGAYTLAPLPLTETQLDELRDVAINEWCKPLADAGVKFRVLVVEGYAPEILIATAKHEDAELVVTGRRGRGGFAELLLGSTSHSLAHHLNRPLLIVP